MSHEITQAPSTARPSLRIRQRAEREQLILQEAESLLAEQGYDGLTMDLLADRVGISKGTIYQHFSTKEDLFGAIVLRGLECVDDHLALLLAEHEQPVIARLAALLTSLIEHHPTWLSAVNGQQKHEIAGTLARHPGLREAFQRYLAKLSALIEEGQKRGELDAAIPAAVAARFLLALTKCRTGTDLPAGVSTEDFATLAIRFYFRGMSAPPAQ